MKRIRMKVKKVCFLLVLAGGIFLFTGEGASRGSISELALSNVEALADGENAAKLYCYGSGSIDCSGNKMEFIVSFLNDDPI